jgi:hypothetical protein
MSKIRGKRARVPPRPCGVGLALTRPPPSRFASLTRICVPVHCTRFAAWADRTTTALSNAFIWARGVPARLGDRVWKLAYYGWIPALLLIGVATSRTPDGRRPSLAAAVLPPN